MTPPQNKAVVCQLVDEVINRRQLAAARRYIADDVVDHGSWPGHRPGIKGFTHAVAAMVSAFPDYHLTIEDLIAADDTVVARVRAHATHTGAFQGLPATGRPVVVTGIMVLRLVAGKIVEHWGAQDDLGLLQQIGVMPLLR